MQLQILVNQNFQKDTFELVCFLDAACPDVLMYFMVQLVSNKEHNMSWTTIEYDRCSMAAMVFGILELEFSGLSNHFGELLFSQFIGGFDVKISTPW